MNTFDNNSISSLSEKLSAASKVTIVTHTHPDGDAVGSSLGMLWFLLARGKDAMILFPDPYGASLDFMFNDTSHNLSMAFSTAEEEGKERIAQSDLIICLDANSFDRTAGEEDFLRSSKAFKVLIDHHIGPDNTCFDMIFSTEKVSSACEVLFYILLGMPEIDGDASRLPAATATALMTGMTTDTNNFGNSVYPTTLEMASKLLDAGVDRDSILSNLYNNYSERRFRSMGYLLHDNMKIYPEGVALMVLDSPTMDKFDIHEGDTEGFVNLPLGIKEVRMSIFLKEDDERFRVSVRSKKGVSANRFAKEYFNGGGHENAAGGTLVFGKNIANRSEAEEYVRKAISRFFSEEGAGSD